mmetsp:Transcript_17398/g.32536  ORF Transcript_17398/g.32536 Transcript_17398/m.32536 type:complete len:308 (+) Transcript_17398:192-1115(+)
MSGAPKTEDYEEDVDYVGGDDDDDDDDDEEDEDDFVPGVDEDHHEEEEDEDDIVPLLDGYLYMDAADHSLHYQGDGFHLSSSEPPAWNVLETSLSSSSQPQRNIGDSLQVIMTGPCDFESEATAKATPRKMKVTFTVVAADSIDPLLGNLASRPRTGNHGGAAANGGGSSSSSSSSSTSNMNTWDNFCSYCYPISDNLVAMWKPHPDDWKPINHSCDPNAWNEEGNGLNVVARRFIPAGEEIRMDYATFCGCFPEMKSFPCDCGADLCRGTITGTDMMDHADLVERYRDHMTDYIAGKVQAAAGLRQ